MAFEHVKMGPIEELFIAWKAAHERASLAESAIENHLAIRAKDRGNGMPDTLRTFVNLKVGHERNGHVFTQDAVAWAAVAECLETVLLEDLQGNLEAAVKATRATADRLRQEFLRATMMQIAGDVPPALTPDNAAHVDL